MFVGWNRDLQAGHTVDPLSNLEINQYMLLVTSFVSVCTLIFVHVRKISSFRYSTFFINFCMLLFLLFKRNRHALALMGRQLDTLGASTLSPEQNHNLDSPPPSADTSTPGVGTHVRTAWTTISKVCGTRLNALCLDIVDYFKSICSTDLMHLLEIRPSTPSEEGLVEGVQLSAWPQQTERISNAFPPSMLDLK